jgi:Mg2+ and Co2+ transporter CorA
MQPEEVILSVIAMVGFAFLAFPLVRALSERIRPRIDAGIRDEVQGLRDDVLTELRDMRREIGELGERVDFTERLLAKQRDIPKFGA